jgi:non-ribosomal peptide synthase protein (TIGR01720 family)
VEETESLLRELPAAYGAPVRDLLLAALARAFGRDRDAGCLLIHLEKHGREPLDEQTDLSRTVGWFTAFHPLVLEPPVGDPLATVAAVTRALERVPRRGVGFGISRYLTPGGDDPEGLRRLERAAVCFNYLGQVDEAFAGDAPFRLADEPSGPDRDPAASRPYPVDVLCAVAGGRLQVEVATGGDAERDAACLAERFVDGLRWLAEGRGPRAMIRGAEDGDDLAAFDPEEMEALVKRYGGRSS